jgi:cell division protein ZapD
LQQQAEFHAREASEFRSRAVISSLLEVLAITGRGDVRADVLKDLDRHAEQLNKYQRAPGIDSRRLTNLLDGIDNVRLRLLRVNKHFTAALRDSEFLSAIQHRSAIPGGTCIFDLPEYGYWLRRPQAERAAQLKEWLELLRPLFDAVRQVLWLTREATVPQAHIAAAGFYQHSMNKNEEISLVRVFVGAATGLFPEISAGQHRFTIRFAEWQGVQERSRQTTADVPFQLALC